MPRKKANIDHAEDSAKLLVHPTPAQATDLLFRALDGHAAFASEEPILAAVERLIAAGADLDEQRPSSGMDASYDWHTPLSLALYRGLERCALALIPGTAFGAPLRNCQECSIVMCARGKPVALAALLAAGADPAVRDDLGRTALMYELHFSNLGQGGSLPPCVAMLLPVSDALAVDDDGNSVPDWAKSNSVTDWTKSNSVPDWTKSNSVPDWAKSKRGIDISHILAAIQARAERQLIAQGVLGASALAHASLRL